MPNQGGGAGSRLLGGGGGSPCCSSRRHAADPIAPALEQGHCTHHAVCVSPHQSGCGDSASDSDGIDAACGRKDQERTECEKSERETLRGTSEYPPRCASLEDSVRHGTRCSHRAGHDHPGHFNHRRIYAVAPYRPSGGRESESSWLFTLSTLAGVVLPLACLA